MRRLSGWDRGGFWPDQRSGAASAHQHNSSDIRDLMIESVGRRFGLVDKLPKPIEWLSDNGSTQGAGLPLATRVQETHRGAEDRERGRRWASTA
jgi:hypothetical protein